MIVSLVCRKPIGVAQIHPAASTFSSDYATDKPAQASWRVHVADSGTCRYQHTMQTPRYSILLLFLQDVDVSNAPDWGSSSNQQLKSITATATEEACRCSAVSDAAGALVYPEEITIEQAGDCFSPAAQNRPGCCDVIHTSGSSNQPSCRLLADVSAALADSQSAAAQQQPGSPGIQYARVRFGPERLNRVMNAAAADLQPSYFASAGTSHRQSISSSSSSLLRDLAVAYEVGATSALAHTSSMSRVITEPATSLQPELALPVPLASGFSACPCVTETLVSNAADSDYHHMQAVMSSTGTERYDTYESVPRVYNNTLSVSDERVSSVCSTTHDPTSTISAMVASTCARQADAEASAMPHSTVQDAAIKKFELELSAETTVSGQLRSLVNSCSSNTGDFNDSASAYATEDGSMMTFEEGLALISAARQQAQLEALAS